MAFATGRILTQALRRQAIYTTTMRADNMNCRQNYLMLRIAT